MSGYVKPNEKQVERGGRIRALRKALALSQDALAEQSGILRTNLSNIETGKDKFTSPETQEKLARALALSIADLLAFTHGELDIETVLTRRRVPGAVPGPLASHTPRYHNAALALRQLEADGVTLPKEVIDAVIDGVRLASEEDPPVRFWRASFDRQLKLHTDYRTATIDTIRKSLGATALQEEDVAAPRRGRR